ncbi:hypothetical protein PRIPAC_91197 [Pristionchus pacificus]|uniref:Uncharacterized protein n=1 Tax=Pristionchus pacificus TaxID=54126 RepID=A0A2A6B9N1_PRIPA|nr:hypothetical protein PRIPAC_91197 [Pristionchus pacificus]|eukprot:PDM62574.1 hypothetical protein PRIPAC_52016 [Pristionchus pacificus]
MDFYSIPDYNGINRIIVKIIEPPDWSRDGYIKVRDRYGSEMDEKRKHQEPTVTDSSSKVEKGGHSVNEKGINDGKKSKETEAKDRDDGRDRGVRRKKDKDKEKKKVSKKSESDKNNSAHAEKLSEFKASLKRTQQPTTPSKPSKGGTTKLSDTPLQHRQKESRKGDKDGGVSKMAPPSGKKPKRSSLCPTTNHINV